MTNVLPDRVDDEITPADEAPNRRTWLKNVALGAAGATAGAMAFGKSASAGDSAGTQIDGNATELGETNTSAAPTIIDYTGPAIDPETGEGPSLFSVGATVPAVDAVFPASLGGYGDDDVVHGVHGSTTNAVGYGVIAANLAPAAPSTTDPAPKGLGVAAANGSQIHFVTLPDAVAGPTAGTHVAGEMYVDLDGTLWFAVPAVSGGTDVRWVKLAATASSGAYHAITPARSYDSRKTSYPVNGPLAPNTNRVVSVADDHHRDSGVVVATDVVPVGATAAVVNITVSSPTDKNFIAVTAGDTTTTATSLQNWDAGVTQIANSVTVPLDATRQIRVYMGDQAGSADIVVDVFGFYL
jgi:hypothetical protein